MAADTTPLSDVRFLTVSEVATIMRVSKMTVYRLVHSGELEAHGVRAALLAAIEAAALRSAELGAAQ